MELQTDKQTDRRDRYVRLSRVDFFLYLGIESEWDEIRRGKEAGASSCFYVYVDVDLGGGMDG